MKSRTRIGRTLVLVIISAILGFNIYGWNAQSLVGNKVPMPFGVGASVVISGSMQPALEIDDLVFIKAKECYEVNDVVVFQSDNMLVIHRIVAIDGDEIITKGDANNIADEPISVDDIKGAMFLKVPYVGKIVSALKEPWAVIAVIALTFYLMESSYKRDKSADEKELDEIKAEIEQLMKEIKEEEKPCRQENTEQTDGCE